MKKIYLLLLPLLFLPFAVNASDFPTFPMAFYGQAKYDGQPLAVGSKIKAYCNANAVGEVSVTELGIYGFDNPTKSKLVIGSYSGCDKLIFKFTNAGIETGGDSVISYDNGFVTASTINKDLNFTKYTAPVTPPSTGGTVGGTGGGAPAPIVKATTTPQVLGVTITLADELITETDGKDGPKVIELQTELIRLGFLPANFTATTIYDEATEAAVKKYQASKISVVTADIQYSKKLNNNFIKVSGNPAVYWFSGEGKRYLFSNRDTFDSWFGDDFSGLRTISQEEFDGVQSGENVTIRPGAFLKFDNSDFTYLVKDNNNICKTSTPGKPIYLVQSGFEVDYNKIGDCAL